MASDEPTAPPARLGDIAAGGGYLGEVVDLPGGWVGLALFNPHGRERTIVHIASDRCRLVTRHEDWTAIVDRSATIAELWRRVPPQDRAHDRGGHER